MHQRRDRTEKLDLTSLTRRVKGIMILQNLLLVFSTNISVHHNTVILLTDTIHVEGFRKKVENNQLHGRPDQYSPHHDSSSSILADRDRKSVGEDELPGPPRHAGTTIRRKRGRPRKLRVIEQTPIRVMTSIYITTTHSNIFILICIAEGTTHNLETNSFGGHCCKVRPSKVCFRELAILKLQKMTTKISLDWENSKLDILHIKCDLKHLR